MNQLQTGDLLPAVLGGRAANGYERDKGHVVHAVKVIHVSPNFIDLSGTAVCGKKEGARSIGFLARKDMEVTCPKCIKALAKGKENG